MARRKKIPGKVETAVLTKSRRRCCLCFGLHGDATEKGGQLAHLDRDPSNRAFDNLAWLCLDHHNSYDSKAQQAKGYTISEVKRHRNKMYLALAKMNAHLSSNTTRIPESAAVEYQEDFTEKVLRELPRRALVALAVRCVWRVQPLLYDVSRDKPERQRHLADLEEALLVAQAFAQGKVPGETWKPVDPVGRPAVVANADAAYATFSNCEPPGTAATAVFHLAFAAWAAWQGDENESISRTLLAIGAADTANNRAIRDFGGNVTSSSSSIFLTASSLDLQTLLGLDLGDFPNLGQRIDPGPDGPLGPLWPERKPDWYEEALERMKGQD
jgi:hypothetical protein